MDIKTVWNPETGTGDWQVDPATGDLAAGDDLETAVLISLFTDRAADPDDIIPDGSNDPRGWWGGDIGSKLWLLERRKATPETLALARDACEQALSWLIDDGIAVGVDVATEFTKPGMLGIQVTIRRRDGPRVALRFSRAWETI